MFAGKFRRKRTASVFRRASATCMSVSWGGDMPGFRRPGIEPSQGDFPTDAPLPPVPLPPTLLPLARPPAPTPAPRKVPSIPACTRAPPPPPRRRLDDHISCKQSLSFCVYMWASRFRSFWAGGRGRRAPKYVPPPPHPTLTLDCKVRGWAGGIMSPQTKGFSRCLEMTYCVVPLKLN